MKEKEKIIYEDSFYITKIVDGNRTTFYKTDVPGKDLFLDGDADGSEDAVPYKTNCQPEDK
ncbi:MAG: hypothetical protein IJ410_01140 [Oscillospiraceae bacterium]|nr:hypothetical protein [Oscillospiraceae bacterium]